MVNAELMLQQACMFHQCLLLPSYKYYLLGVDLLDTKINKLRFVIEQHDNMQRGECVLEESVSELC